jgi:3-hydroxyacyl-CoA dehydrogenase
MIAEIVSGGDIDQGSFVSEQWFLDMERKAFLELLNIRRPRNASWA